MIRAPLVAIALGLSAFGLSPPSHAQAPETPQGYPPPPPRPQGAPPPFDYPFEPPPTASAQASAQVRDHRWISFTAAVGPGGLFGKGENKLAVSYQLFRLAVALEPDLAVFVGFEGVGTASENPATGRESWLKQDVWLAGLQGHVWRALYLRGGMGIGAVSEKAGGLKFSGGRGITAAAAVGYEILQRRHLALSLDLNGSYTSYAKESWTTAGLQVAISVF